MSNIQVNPGPSAPTQPRRRRSGCLMILIILFAGLSWLIYGTTSHASLETEIACRMRCSYNYRGTEMKKLNYANGQVYYQCVEQ